MAKIVFWLGPSPEPWSPLTALETGIGGSETAAIHMSRELALMEHEVVVYARVPTPCSDVVGVNPGDVVHPKYGNQPKYGNVVLWNSYMEFEPGEVECDLFISSRQPEARRQLAPKCSQAWLWMHDLHCGSDWDNAISDYDKVLCLSSWARERFLLYYPAVDPSKVVQTSNGLDLTRFQGRKSEGLRPEAGFQHRITPAGSGFPLRVTWSSSPDRGLDRLLDFWPKIYERYGAGSTLHVYYGFDTWKKMATIHGQLGNLNRIKLFEDRLASMSCQGVVFHGRRGQQEIADSYLRSQLWLYPTSFEEVSCITAMEAQAAGCKIVCTRCGALPETAPGAWLVDPTMNEEVYKRKFLEAVHEALRADSPVDFQPFRMPKTWKQVAEEWNQWM